LHQYDLYAAPTNKIKYHKIKRAYTRAYYSQGASQNDHIFKGEFSRDFAKGFNLNVNYERINHVGQFRSQRTRLTSFATALRYKRNEQYDAYLSFNTNVVQQQDNGGASAPIDPNFLGDPIAWSVETLTARTRHEHRTLSFTHHYQLNKTKAKRPSSPRDSLSQFFKPDLLNRDSLGQIIRDSITTDSIKTKLEQDSILTILKQDTVISDSTKLDSTFYERPQSERPRPNLIDSIQTPKSKRAYNLTHHVLYRSNKYKAYDDAPDSSFYRNFFTDQRGLRNYIDHRQLENTFKISTFMPRKKDNSNLQTQRDLIEVGLVHKLHFLDQEVKDSTFSNLFLTGAINFNPNDRLKINTYAHFGLLASRGDYRLSGDLYLDLKIIGNLKIQFINTLYTPSLIQEQLYISKKEFWNNNFDKTLETNISATYSLPKFKFEVTGKYHLLNNFIYYDTLGLSQQSNQVINIAQLIVKKDFRFGKLGIDNIVALQAISGDVIRLPSFYSKHSLYLEGRLFRKILHTKIGLDLRMTSSYFSNIYNSLTGQFHLQDNTSVNLYPAVDAFIAFHVRKFRAFLKMENITDFITDETYFQVAGYPMPFNEFRFGVSWRFTD